MSQLSQASAKALLKEDYLSGDLKSTELIKRLQKLQKHLKKVEQLEDKEQQKLDTVSAALVQEDIIKHENADVKLLVACCLTDVIRIYVPNAPYDDAQLEDVFSLFISQLRGLDNISDESFTLRYYLLENLESVKAFNLLIDLNNDALFVELFKTFFECITKEHSVAVVTCMLDIMQNCLAESEEVSQQLLDAILTNLLPKSKKERPASYRLAQQLIKACSKLLQPVITQFLNGILLDVKASDSDLKDKGHILIWELNRIDPDMLLYVLPELDKELSVDILEKRKEAVALLARMFSMAESKLHQNYPGLFTTFMARFNDIDSSIRCEMLKFAPTFLRHHSDFGKDVIAGLTRRIRDQEEEPRLAAVEAVCEVASENPDLINKELLAEVGMRMRDKKPEIRKAALYKLAELYKQLLQKWGMPSEWTDKHTKSYGWIPTKVLHVYYQNDVDLRIVVDEVLDHSLLPDDYDVKKRTKLLLEIRSTLDKHASDAIIRLLQEKHSFQTDFASFLELRKQLQKKPSDKTLEAEIATKITSLVNRLPGGNQKFQQLRSMKSADSWKHLTTLASADVDYSKIRKAAEAALESLHKRSKEGAVGEYFRKVVQKLCMTIINQQTIPLLFGAVNSALKHSAASFPAILSFIEEISGVFPSFFKTSFTELSTLLEEEDDLAVDKALKILAKVADHISGDATSKKNLKGRLSALCIQGTPTQAKCAVKAINKLYEDKNQIFSKVLKDAVPHLQIKDKTCATALQALAHIAKAQLPSFHKFVDQVLEFVLETLLPARPKGNQQALELCKCKMIGMKALVNYLGAHADGEDEALIETARKVVRAFLDIIETESKGLSANKDQNAADKEYMRQSAAISLIKLARYRSFEALLTEDDFQKVAFSVQDPCHEVRLAILDAVIKGLKTMKLPLKYMIMLVLCATDIEKKTIFAKAKQGLALNIKLRRQLLEVLNKDKLSGEKKSTFGVLPEYVLPYLIHFLAHRHDWKADVPEYKISSRYLMFFLEQLHLGDNVSFLQALLAFMKQTQDAQEPPREENIRILCDIALLYINSKAASKGKLTQKNHMGNLYLPPALFRVTEDDSALQKELVEGGKSYLPQNFSLPNAKKEKIFKEAPTPLPEKTGEKRKAKKSPTKAQQSPKKRAKKNDDDAFEASKAKESRSPRRTSLSRKAKDDIQSMRDQDSDQGEESPDDAATAQKGRKRRAPESTKAGSAKKRSKKAPSEEEEDSPDQEAEEEAPKAGKGKGKRGAKTAGNKKSKAFEMSEEEEEEEEEEEQKPAKARKGSRGKRTTTKKQTKKQTKAASPEPSKTHTVRRTTKRSK